MRMFGFTRRLAWGLALALLPSLAVSCRPQKSDPPLARKYKRKARRAPEVPAFRAKPGEGDRAAVLELLETELQANFAQLSDPELDLPAYFLGYQLYDIEEMWVVAEDGALVVDDIEHQRTVDVDVRVGDAQLDNSHTRDGDYGPGSGLGSGLPVSLDDDALSLAQGLWMDTDAQFQAAVSAYRDIESSEQLRSEGEPEHPDFSEETPLVHIEPTYALDFPQVRDEYRPVLREVSEVLGDDPAVLQSHVALSVVAENRYLVTSEGSRVQSGSTRLRILLDARAQAEDGMVLQRTATFEAHERDQLPEAAMLRERAAELRAELLALRDAPIADPYTGPAILEGRAAGVFFHEIFGHRLEGHRQKDDLEGQTFTDKLGEYVLPRFLDVVDDPTVTKLAGTPLSGHYFVDDEAVRSQRTVLVDKGKLRGFLLSRSPVLPFTSSNGHGRREPGNQVVARQGNLIISSHRTVTRNNLRAALIDEVRKQGKPYGLRFEDIEGGYTITDRSGPQAFKVQPLMVYRVYADGRPDELVRGVEIVGTPLSAFETIIATDDKPGIFNGMCGAESGWVPVSAVSPSLLLRGIEIERAVHDRDRPPLLQAPPNLRRSR